VNSQEFRGVPCFYVMEYQNALDGRREGFVTEDYILGLGDYVSLNSAYSESASWPSTW